MSIADAPVSDREQLEQWARELLARCSLPDAKCQTIVVHLVEPGCICFVGRRVIGPPRPFTALLANGAHGAYIRRIVAGWAIPADPAPAAVLAGEGECDGA